MEKNLKGELILEKPESISQTYPSPVKKLTFELLENVQFIYELVLAQLELEAFGLEFEIDKSFRRFFVSVEPHRNDILRKRLAYFKTIGDFHTDYYYIVRKNRTKSINQYLTHWIYPYKGKFHPQMVRALMNVIGLKKGDTVLDPFVGSGTTALEAQLLGINCVGIDISPVCVLQSKVKTESVNVVDEILKWEAEVLNRVASNLFGFDLEDFDELMKKIPDEKVRNFYVMAKLVSISDKVRRRKDFLKSFVKNVELMIASVEDYRDVVLELGLDLGRVDIRMGDARNLPLMDESVDGIITSPPYSIALDYVNNDSHVLRELGYDPEIFRESVIGVRGKGKTRLDLYNEDMKKSLKEMYRVLKRGKYAVIIIGNATYQGKEIRTVEFTIDYAEKIGFKLVNNIDKIIFGLYNVMQKESILIFKKG